MERVTRRSGQRRRRVSSGARLALVAAALLGSLPPASLRPLDDAERSRTASTPALAASRAPVERWAVVQDPAGPVHLSRSDRGDRPLPRRADGPGPALCLTALGLEPPDARARRRERARTPRVRRSSARRLSARAPPV